MSTEKEFAPTASEIQLRRLSDCEYPFKGKSARIQLTMAYAAPDDSVPYACTRTVRFFRFVTLLAGTVRVYVVNAVGRWTVELRTVDPSFNSTRTSIEPLEGCPT